jgi:dynein heavy chain
LNITAPNVKQMKRIFGAILSAKLADFDNDVRLMGDSLMHVCIGVYVEVVKELLPTPSKSHYVFNMRDLAKVSERGANPLMSLGFRVCYVLNPKP